MCISHLLSVLWIGYLLIHELIFSKKSTSPLLHTCRPIFDKLRTYLLSMGSDIAKLQRTYLHSRLRRCFTRSIRPFVVCINAPNVGTERPFRFFSSVIDLHASRKWTNDSKNRMFSSSWDLIGSQFGSRCMRPFLGVFTLTTFHHRDMCFSKFAVSWKPCNLRQHVVESSMIAERRITLRTFQNFCMS